MFKERKSKTYLRVFVDFLCGEMSDQRICLKFRDKNGIKCSEAFEILKKAFGDDAMSQARVYEWYKRFQKGEKTPKVTQDLGVLAHTSLLKTWKKFKAIVLVNCKIVIREVSEEIGILYGSCKAILINVLNINQVS